MSNKVLILFAHPRFERSLINTALLNQIPSIPEITFHDLYEKYPDFNIDVEYEKKLLSEHQVIIWQHPFYWYSAPPLLKQWIDLVLGFGWAYGPGGVALQGKFVLNSISAGGQRNAYSKEGHNRFTIRELLAPFDQTATLCKMIYLPPFAVHGTHVIIKDDLGKIAIQYQKMLERLVAADFSPEEVKKFAYMNDWLGSLTE
jgi:glutathione-regulated potassium-efflux system ancillary protein KefG